MSREPQGAITIAQAADNLNVCTKTIRRYIIRGLLPAIRLGPRTLRIRRADFALFKAKRLTV